MEKAYVIGIDMGGTNTSIGIVNQRGEILHKAKVSTANHATADGYVNAVCASINSLIEENGLTGQVKGIGMGVPNGNMHTGTVEQAANIPWAKKVVPMAEMITEGTCLPCRLTNDANAAALGEMIYGAAIGKKDFIVITLGTGLGSGIVANGQLIVGHDGFAGELGHVIVVPHNGRFCGCGRSGCLETYASATGVARSAREFLELNPEKKSLLQEITHRPIESKDVFEAAQKGDELAISIFNYTGKILGEAICNFIAFSSPELIILFGGLAHAGKFLINPIEKAVEDNILSIYKGKTKIVISKLNDAEAPILGASALAWES